jgi:UDP-N-acetylmuramyl pentapeptide phosphotransferase/UDP-N-acetylglucosamine-1-phosphate transferase
VGYLPVLILPGLVCATVLWLMLRFARRYVPMDVPNERSLHHQAVPRVGGIAIFAGVGSAALLGLAPMDLPLKLALGLALFSFVDDVRPLPRLVRFIAHLAAAGLVVWYLLSPMLALELVLLWLSVAWITNLYNFMDGSDGLAGGMGFIGFGAYGLAAVQGGDSGVAALSFALSGACIAFLAFNFHPARVFLGDVGSIPLGFLAASVGIVGWRGDLWPLWFPVLVFGPFIGDATITLVRRLIRREAVWHAHREHYYQRMVRMGLGHRNTACISYVAMLLCAFAALLGRAAAPDLQAVAFISGTAVLAALAVWVDFAWRRFVRRIERPA